MALFVSLPHLLRLLQSSFPDDIMLISYWKGG
nr:MAG TPA: hypothetical protein [Caudoviricetes sp.]